MESRDIKRPLTVENDDCESEIHRQKHGRTCGGIIIFGGEPRSVDCSRELADLLDVAQSRPHEIRSYIYARAVELAVARGCTHGDKMTRWTPETSAHVSTCGRLQAHLVAAIDMKVRTECSILQTVVYTR